MFLGRAECEIKFTRVFTANPVRLLPSLRTLLHIRFTHGRLHSWGSQLDLVEGMETGESLSSSSPARSTAGSLGSEARSAVSSPQGEGSVLLLSSSEEVDVESVEY